MHAVAAAATERSLDRLIPVLAGVAADAMDSARTAICVSGPDGVTVSVCTAPEGGDDFKPIAAALTTRLERAFGSPVCRTLATIADDLRNAGYAHVGAAPLSVKGVRTGALCFARTEDRAYTDDEIEWAQMLADQIAIHLETARLQAESPGNDE